MFTSQQTQPAKSKQPSSARTEFPFVKQEPVETASFNVDTNQIDVDVVEQNAESEPSSAPAAREPSFLPFVLGEMLQTEAPEEPQSSRVDPYHVRAAASFRNQVQLEYDTSDSHDIATVSSAAPFPQSNTTSRMGPMVSLSRPNNFNNNYFDAESVSEPVHLEPGSQSQQAMSEDMMEFDDEDVPTPSTVDHAAERRKIESLRKMGLRLRSNTAAKEKDSDASKDEDSSEDEAKAFAPSTWRQVAGVDHDEDDQELFDTSRKQLKRKRETSSTFEAESPSKRAKIRHQQKQQLNPQESSRSNFVKMVCLLFCFPCIVPH